MRSRLFKIPQRVRLYNNNPFDFKNFMSPPFFDFEDNLIYQFVQRYPKFFLGSAAITAVTVVWAMLSAPDKKNTINPEQKENKDITLKR